MSALLAALLTCPSALSAPRSFIYTSVSGGYAQSTDVIEYGAGEQDYAEQRGFGVGLEGGGSIAGAFVRRDRPGLFLQDWSRAQLWLGALWQERGPGHGWVGLNVDTGFQVGWHEERWGALLHGFGRTGTDMRIDGSTTGFGLGVRVRVETLYAEVEASAPLFDGPYGSTLIRGSIGYTPKNNVLTHGVGVEWAERAAAGFTRQGVSVSYFLRVG